MNVPTAACDQDFDHLIHTLYALSAEEEWTRFRLRGLEMLCAYCGAVGASWLTHSGREKDGEYTEFPAVADSPARAALVAYPGQTVAAQHLSPLPEVLRLASDPAAVEAWLLLYAHRSGGLCSRLLLRFRPGTAPARPEALQRLSAHLVEAGALALRQFIQRDEWLYALGRPNRGTAALIDASGTVYSASGRFRDYIRQSEDCHENFSELPFPLPRSVLDGEDHFVQRSLHFRVSRQGHLFLLHARRPLPMDSLSPREQEIARALGSGKTFKSVARQYDIAVSTVANHASRIYRKLGIYRREDLVELVRQSGARSAAA